VDVRIDDDLIFNKSMATTEIRTRYRGISEALSKPGTPDLRRHVEGIEHAIETHQLSIDDCRRLYRAFVDYVEYIEEKSTIPEHYDVWVKYSIAPLLRPTFEGPYNFETIYRACADEIPNYTSDAVLTAYAKQVRGVTDRRLTIALNQGYISPDRLRMVCKHFKVRNWRGHYFRDDQPLDEVVDVVAKIVDNGTLPRREPGQDEDEYHAQLKALEQVPITLREIARAFTRLNPGGGVDMTEPLPPYVL
jgi:hypothetical protein